MATPFNPFSAPRGNAQAAATSTPGHGRGASTARGAPFQPRGSRSRASKWRGTGRGQSISRGRGRGAGAASTGVSHAAASLSQTPNTGNINSPFAQIKQQYSMGTPFENQKSQRSPLSAIANGDPGRNGQFAPRGALKQEPQRQLPMSGANNGSIASIPVEDASTVTSYHERYEQLKLDRAKQRQLAIRDGQMADPNQPTSLKQAITPVGTCTSMCPEFERVERIVQKMVDKSEKYLHPSTNMLQNMETKMLKRFRRSAAGYDEQLPSDIRTPKTLLQAMNYLIRYVIGGNEPLGTIHKFVWDRTRSIRNDFSVQQVTQEDDVKTAVTCLERIARFHIVSLHLLSSPANEEPFDRHQEREQLNNTMLSLMYYYDDNRERIAFPNEDEFRAYYILFSIHDQRPDLEARVQKWPSSLLNSPRVQVALDLYAASCNTWDYQGTLDARRPNAIAQGFYTRFFNIINSPSVSYLMACVAEIYFNHVRQTAIRAIWKGYCRQPISQQSKNEEWTVDELTQVLHFDDEEQTIKFCNEQGLTLSENASGQLYVDWGSRPVDSITFSPSSEHSFSETYVESKRAGRSLVAVILGMTIREAARMGMVDKSYLHQRVDKSADIPIDDDSLFVTDKYNESPAPVVEMNSPSLESESESTYSNVFQNPAPSSTANPFANAQPAAQHPFNPPQMTSPANPFASMFSAAPAANNIPAPPTPSQNPFSSMFSGGTAASGPPASTMPAASNPFVMPAPKTLAPSEPSPSPFSFSKPPETSQKEETPAATTAPAAAPVQFSSMFSGGTAASGPAASTLPAASNPFAVPAPKTSTTSEPSPSPFSFSKPPETSQKEETPAATTAPAAAPVQFSSTFSGGSFLSATSGASTAKPNPFASLSSFAPPKPSEPSQSSLFPTSNPLFPSAGANGNSSAAVSTTAAESAVKTSSPSSFAHPSSSSLFKFPTPATTAPNTNNPFSFAATNSPTQQSSSLFKSVSPQTSQGHSQSLFMPSKQSSLDASLQEQNSLFSSNQFAPRKSTPLLASGDIQHPKPLFSNATAGPSVEKEVQKPQPKEMDTAFTPPGSPKIAPTETNVFNQGSKTKPESRPAMMESSRKSVDRGSQTDEWNHPDYASTEELKTAGDGSLYRDHPGGAHPGREEGTTRKRALEEPVAREFTAEESGSKVAKVSKATERSPPAKKKYSLIEQYSKAVPTLPCLERAKELCKPKLPTEEGIQAAKPNNRQVDEDELLLNAARIAAEQLRNGSIFEGFSQYDPPYVPYYGPGSSLDSIFERSTRFSQSLSPPPRPTHNYKVAYGPERPDGSMSRTEERIRRTGAKGYAGIPLDFTSVGRDQFARKIKDEDKDKDDKFSRSE